MCDFRARPLPVLDRERVERQDVDAEPRRRFHDVAHRVDAGAVAFDPRQVPLRRPAAVAVHDDGDVRGKPLEVDLARQRFVGRSWRNPRQQLLKRHACPSRETPIVSTTMRQRRGRVVLHAHQEESLPPARSARPGRGRRDASTSRHPLGGRRPRPTSTSVPTMVRTMCRRNPLARDRRHDDRALPLALGHSPRTLDSVIARSSCGSRCRPPGTPRSRDAPR